MDPKEKISFLNCLNDIDITMTHSLPILIFECANAHGGDRNVLRSTIEKFGEVNYPNKHIKFQAFHPDTIALPDFSGYPIYQDLLMGLAEWKEMIDIASDRFDGIWLDIFDKYGVDVFTNNIDRISGIKLQASVLENREIFEGLKEDSALNGKLLMINISGFTIEAVQKFVDEFSILGMQELILQIGHQAYPTLLKDTGIQKIDILKASFPGYRLCIADHAQAEDDFSCIIPLLGVSAGASIVEKHICLERKGSKYDFYSALEFPEMQLLANRVISTWEIVNGPFVSESESDYLKKSIQIPVANVMLPKGSLVAGSDLVFRRTAQVGVPYEVIAGIQNRLYILNDDIQPKTSLQENQFKQANIAVIVACRMKSSRLKSKAFLPISGVSSIERCLLSCLEIKEASKVILATSTTEEDSVLNTKLLDGKVEFWQGDPDDVIERYIGACEKHSIDVVVRVTGDCPVISADIASYLLKHHFNSGADYAAAKDSAVGTACEVYNVEALKRILKYVGKAKYSEYMTWYMQNNKDVFKVEMVDLPQDLIRNYRLTLDYPEDLELFNRLFEALESEALEPNIANIFKVLDNNPHIASLNAGLTLMYKTDQALIDRLNKETRIAI